jgi:hypothetical protein
MTIGQRIEVLEQRLGELKAQLQGLESRLDTTATELRQQIEAVKFEARQSHDALRERLDRAEKQQTEINARAFPLIGFGILLSSLAAEIARLPVLLNLAIVVLSTGFAFQVIQPIAEPGWIEWQEGRRKRGIPSLRERWCAAWAAVEGAPVTVPHWLLLNRLGG